MQPHGNIESSIQNSLATPNIILTTSQKTVAIGTTTQNTLATSQYTLATS